MTYLIVEDEKIYRYIIEFKEAKKIIEILNQNEDSRVVKTKVVSDEKKAIEHEYIFPIIHSGEYTTSMAYDVINVILDMSIEYLNKGIYMCDALPHNYTYNKGRWILYDFGAFELKPKNVKTLIRNVFKIVISSIELLKITSRKELKHYFLNRISHSYFSKMVPQPTFLSFSLKSNLCLLLYTLKLNKLAYLLAKYYLKQYEKGHKKEYFDPTITEKDDKQLYDIVDNFLKKEKSETVFMLGKNTAKWAINSSSDCEKFAYIDDYDFCDKYYNYIYKNSLKNISTAVLYPLLEDENISTDLTYRAIYDSFTRERFCSDTVVAFDFSELTSTTSFCMETYIKHICGYAQKSILLSFDKTKEQELFESAKNELQKYFKEIEIIETTQNIVIISNNKKEITYPNAKKYLNANRCLYDDIHSEKIIKIIKNK